jgi:pantoate--beta-alanine ligase
VNPSQFGPNEDFAKYPRTLEEDLEKCEAAGATLVFAPQKKEIYPEEKPFITFNVDESMTSILCGKNRPGHFEGVVQVVSILFNIVSPDVAYFGEKDFQQLSVIKKMTESLHFQVEIRSVPTIRESDGLAMSSRNRYLSPENRELAANIYKTMKSMRTKAHDALFDRRAIPVEFAESEAKKQLEDLIPQAQIDYVEIRNDGDLSKSRFLSNSARIFVALKIGDTRLIDNMFLGKVNG